MSKVNEQNVVSIEEAAEIQNQQVNGTVTVESTKRQKFVAGAKKFGKRIAIGLGVVFGTVLVYTIGEKHGEKKAKSENNEDVYIIDDTNDTNSTSDNSVE